MKKTKNNFKSKGQIRYQALLSQKEPEILKIWEKEQGELRKKLIKKDDFNWTLSNSKEENKNEDSKELELDIKETNNKKNNLEENININKIIGNEINESNNHKNYLIKKNDKKDTLRYIGGVDISFDIYDKDVGISALVVCDIKDNFNIVYEDFKLIKIEEPYIPGFLAFREVNHFVELINDLKNKKPELIPQVILVDGNGILHTRGFGLASHLGVLVDIPTIGCAKTVFAVDGITKRKVENIYYYNLKKYGDSYPLVGKSKEILGYALRSTDYYDGAMIISLGHRISNETALEIVKMCCYYRVPEPTRLADKISRRLIKAYQNFVNKYPNKKFNLKKYFHKNFNYIHNKLY